ncbi:MAG: hypothetical protein JOZ05_25815 [Acetobacteraceae bacterium]|nr:hypothetical protein [Acetobacteraceae bacterium]
MTRHKDIQYASRRMHIIRLLASMLDGEDHTLERAPWLDEVDPLEGFILHEAERGTVVSTS